MFRQVYFHRTLRSAEVMLKALLKRALELYKTGGSVWFAPETAFEKILRGEKLNLSDYLELDDSDLIFHIKQWQRSADAILSDLSRRFINRRLFKAFDLDMPDGERREFLRRARVRVEESGFDPNFYFVEDHARDVSYYSFYSAKQADLKNQIFVEDGFSRPQIREISEVSAAVRGLQQGFEIHRACFPSELQNEIAPLYHGSLTGKANG
jgi:hypothetical protein